MAPIQPASSTVTDGLGRVYHLPDPVKVEPYVWPTLFGSDYQPMADLTKRYPGAKSTRVYGPTGMPSAAKINQVPTGVILVGVSFHGPVVPAAVRAAIDGARRPGRLILVEPLHEMNRSTAHGGPTPAQYHRDFDALAAVVLAEDPTGEQVALTQTYMGYAARHPEPGREWDKFTRDDVAFVGVDLEWDAKLGTARYPTPPALQGIALEIRDNHPAKVPVIYPEFAWRRLPYDTTGRDCAQFYVDHAAYAVANQVYAVNIYDTNGTTGAYRLLDGSPELATVKKIIG